MLQHFPIFDLAVKKSRTTQSQHLNIYGCARVSNATYQVSRPSVHVLWRIRYLKAFTIYGRGGHTGHVTLHFFYKSLFSFSNKLSHEI